MFRLLCWVEKEKSSEVEINFLYETSKYAYLEAGESEITPSLVRFVD